MKAPRILLEWDCDGIGCSTLIQAEPRGPLTELTDAEVLLMLEDAGCRLLGRQTLFCAECADPRHRAPVSLQKVTGS